MQNAAQSIAKQSGTTVVFSTPILSAEASKGNQKHWQGHILKGSEGDSYTAASFWQDVASGAPTIQHSALVRVHGKNIGRANETTPEDQARSELDATTNKKRDKGYRASGETEAELPLPMLAHKWGERKHSVAGQALAAQPKLDGCRALYQSGRSMWSRKGKDFIAEVYAHLQFDTQGYITDGELMLPKPGTFQESMSAVKKYRPGLSDQLEYHVYDLVLPDMAFEDRSIALKGIVDAASRVAGDSFRVRIVPTILIHSDDGLLAAHAKFVADGYEGTIIRTLDGLYSVGHRSVDLLKHKDFVDAEYLVVGITEGRGNMQGAAIFQCVTAAGQPFDCSIKGTMADRRHYFQNPGDYVGRQLTVRYQELSDSGIPRFPVGLSVRDHDLQG